MQQKLKKIRSDASFREFFRLKKGNKTSIIVTAKKERYRNLIAYSAINKFLKMSARNKKSNCIGQKFKFDYRKDGKLDNTFVRINISKNILLGSPATIIIGLLFINIIIYF